MDTMQLETTMDSYEGDFPTFKLPLIKGFFSVNEEGRYFSSTKNLSYLQWNRFSSRKIHLDLTVGENTSVRRTEENNNVFYRYLADRPTMVQEFAGKTLQQAGFVCNRQVLRKMANIPYQDREHEVFTAYLYQGNIYLGYIKAEEVKNDKWERCSRWGYKFEQFLLAARPGLEPVTNVPVKEGEEFACVFTTKLRDHRLLYAAEMDGVFIDFGERVPAVPDTQNFGEELIITELGKKKFVELKTCSFSETNPNFRKNKSREIWLQCFVAGVETVVIGIRNYNGIVSQLKKFSTEEMWEIGREFWSPIVCMNFMERMLTFIKECFQHEMKNLSQWKPEDDITHFPPLELIFERAPGSNVMLSRKECNGVRQYLYDWFLNGVAVDANC